MLSSYIATYKGIDYKKSELHSYGVDTCRHEEIIIAPNKGNLMRLHQMYGRQESMQDEDTLAAGHMQRTEARGCGPRCSLVESSKRLLKAASGLAAPNVPPRHRSFAE